LRRTIAASAANFQSCNSDLETGFGCDLRFQLFKQRARKLFDSAAAKTGQVDMLTRGLHLVKMLFTFQVHQVEFVYEAQLLQKIDGPINRGSINFGVARSGELEQRSCVEVLLSVLNHFDDSPALRGDPNASRVQFVEQGAPMEGWTHAPPLFCDQVATELTDTPK
jgi:hypothetical protein